MPENTPTNYDIIQRVVALERDTKTLEKKIDVMDKDLKEEFSSIQEKLDELIVLKSRFDGGYKIVTIIAGIVLVAAGFLGWFIDKWQAIKEAIF